ncbi:hypothetical protein CEXT_538571 [Caerostris extrusa]|uniref:Uncharacterized protein n=1 Tax=Caerostris extrusa TaxID=172846 RepID=A0AAV4SSB6_CAEEX|nr:hypothetical protein CEXT_538571 [Caerostris extrusa]
MALHGSEIPASRITFELDEESEEQLHALLAQLPNFFSSFLFLSPTVPPPALARVPSPPRLGFCRCHSLKLRIIGQPVKLGYPISIKSHSISWQREEKIVFSVAFQDHCWNFATT